MRQNREADLVEFYRVLHELEQRLDGPRMLARCSARSGWPRRGVYFFQESSEVRTSTGAGARIVRVGTHALKAGSRTTLRNRLSQHRGQARSGTGNHRGSIFRLIVGSALLRRHHLDCPTWGRGSSAPRSVREQEVEAERTVSAAIGRMPFLWLAVEDEPGPASLRGYIERNAIALLSNSGKTPLDPPSPGWLGHDCDRERVRRSGLWNQNHVDEPYDPDFLVLLRKLVANMPEQP